MNETEIDEAIVRFYDWVSSDRLHYLHLWESTKDAEMKTYYGEKTSTYTSIKLYLEKYFKGLINIQKNEEKTKHGL